MDILDEMGVSKLSFFKVNYSIDFPQSHSLGCTSLLTLHECPLLAEPLKHVLMENPIIAYYHSSHYLTQGRRAAGKGRKICPQRPFSLWQWLVTRMIRSLKRFVQKKNLEIRSRTPYWGDHFLASGGIPNTSISSY